MRHPSIIHPWLSEVDLAQWTREAQTADQLRRRLAVWLTHLRYHARQVAEFLQVSVQAVWLWVAQYNRRGPEGLDRQGRGGRRWGFLNLDEENRLLNSIRQKAEQGQVLTAKQLWPLCCQSVGRKVSMAYVYRLLHRHRWRKLSPRPRHRKALVQQQQAFKKTSLRSGLKQ